MDGASFPENVRATPVVVTRICLKRKCVSPKPRAESELPLNGGFQTREAELAVSADVGQLG